MTESTADYLQHLGDRPYPNLPDTTSGTMRLDIQGEGRTDHWYLTIDQQRVQVVRSARDADLLVRGTQEVFDRLVDGRTHVAVSLMRGEVEVEGNLRLLMLLRRLFRGPEGARHPRDAAREVVHRTSPGAAR
jgi:putative sterol carrier protein